MIHTNRPQMYDICVSRGGQKWIVRRRYTEFDKLQGQVQAAGMPHKHIAENTYTMQLVKSVALPPFPAKKWFGSNSPAVTEQRRLALAAFLAAAATSAECCSDPAL
eukprot:COSAG05_NODE_3334_length_2145_cov_2.370479_3_plen_106_part_00